MNSLIHCILLYEFLITLKWLIVLQIHTFSEGILFCNASSVNVMQVKVDNSSLVKITSASWHTETIYSLVRDAIK